MGELATTLLVIPAGEATLAIRIYTLMHYGAHKLVCALCVILIGLIIAGYAAVYMPTLVLPRYRIISNAMFLFFMAFTINMILSKWGFYRRLLPFGDKI